MRTITKTITTDLFTFSELDKKAQAAVIENLTSRLENNTYLWLPEDMRYRAEEIISKEFGNTAIINELYYQLSYMQSDYVCIEMSGTYYGLDFTVRDGRYGIIIDGSVDYLNEKRYEQLKRKIERINSELMQYGYSLIEQYWNASNDEIIADAIDSDIISNEQYYLADGTIYND